MSLGSRKSRSASPNRFTARIVTVMAVPGKTTIHHGGLKFLLHVRHVKGKLKFFGDSAGVPDVGQRAAGSKLIVDLGGHVVELERDADDVIALMFEPGRGRGAVHPAAHGDDDTGPFFRC